MHNMLGFLQNELDDAKAGVTSEVLNEDWRWLLQIKSSKQGEKKWVDWLYIAQSEYVAAHLGVFAARDFPKGCIIGYYSGPVKWRAATAGQPEPKEEELRTALGEKVGETELTYVDCEGHWVVIEPERVERDAPAPLYMGLHYLNNPAKVYRKGTQKYMKSAKEQNVGFERDGSVHATKKISPHSELLILYTGEERELVEARAAKEPEQKKPAAVGKFDEPMQQCDI